MEVTVKVLGLNFSVEGVALKVFGLRGVGAFGRYGVRG